MMVRQGEFHMELMQESPLRRFFKKEKTSASFTRLHKLTPEFD